jgi:hypothetical protein
MGYITLFGEKLDALLAGHGVGEDGRAEIVAYVKDTVLESYRNGLEQGKKEGGRRPPRKGKRRAKPDPDGDGQ